MSQHRVRDLQPSDSPSEDNGHSEAQSQPLNTRLAGIMRACTIDTVLADKRSRGWFSLDDKKFEKELIAAENRAIDQIHKAYGDEYVLLKRSDSPFAMFTGAEWLARFRAELDNLPTYYDDQVDIIRAAKRASGVDDE